MIPYNFMISTSLLFRKSVFITVSIIVVLIAHNHVSCAELHKSNQIMFGVENEFSLSQVYSDFGKLIRETVLMMENSGTYFKVRIDGELHTRNFAEMYFRVLRCGQYLTNIVLNYDGNVLGCSNFHLYMKLFIILNNKLKILLVKLEDAANKGDNRQDPEYSEIIDILKSQYRPIVTSLNHNLHELICLAMLANPLVKSWEQGLPEKCSVCDRNSTILYRGCTHQMDISCLVTSYVFYNKKCFQCNKQILMFLDNH